MTTTQELDRARADLAEAQADLENAGRLGAISRDWRAADDHRQVQVKVRGLERRVRTLTDELAAAEQAQAARDRAEQEAAPRLHAAGRALEESRNGLAAALADAEQALTALHRQAAAHAALVEQTRAEVSAMGLRAGTRTDGTPHTNAAEVMRGVVLDGRTWWALEPPVVLVHAMQGAVAGAVGPHHPLATRLRALEGPDGGKVDEQLRAPQKPRGKRGTLSGRVES